MPRLAVHDPKGSCTPKRPAPSLCTARVYGGRIPRSLVHTRSRAARQRPMQGGALHHRAFCVNFWIESLPGSYKDRKAVAAALKEIYRAVDATAGEAALTAFEDGPWGRKYAAIAPSWRRAWGEVVPF